MGKLHWLPFARLCRLSGRWYLEIDTRKYSEQSIRQWDHFAAGLLIQLILFDLDGVIEQERARTKEVGLTLAM
jgi:hypothetical protein